MKIKLLLFLLINIPLYAMQPMQWLRNAEMAYQNDNTQKLLGILTKARFDDLDLQNASALINAGVNVNEQDASGNSLLYFAALRDLVEVVQKLLQKGANPNIKNKLGASALGIAASSNHKQLVQALLEAGADPNLRLTNNSTALIMAVRYGRPENNNNKDAIALLINAKANLDLQNDSKETALNVAVVENNLELVKALLEAGADPNIEDAKGESALLLAKKNEELWEYIFEFKRLRRLKQMSKKQ